MKENRYLALDPSDGDHHFVLVDGIPKPKKTLSEKEAKEVTKKEGSRILFLIRE